MWPHRLHFREKKEVDVMFFFESPFVFVTTIKAWDNCEIFWKSSWLCKTNNKREIVYPFIGNRRRLEAYFTMVVKTKFLVIFILLFIFQDGAENWRRRRRRQCTPQDFQVSCWDSWRSCSASTCGREGSQSRSRSVTSYASCGGGSCPELHESLQCYGSPTENWPNLVHGLSGPLALR